jgi:hypothetical protein
MFPLPLRFVIVAVLAIFILIWSLEEIDKTIHFCLSSLSMIDFDVLAENSVLSGLLGGVIATNPRDIMPELPLMKAVGTVAREGAIHIRPDGVIIAANLVIEERWGIHSQDCIDANLALIISFPPRVDHFTPKPGIEITLVGDDVMIPINANAFPVRHGTEVTGFVLFFEDMRDQRQETAAFEAEVARAKELVESIVPFALRGKMTEVNKSLIYVANWIAVLCVQIAQFAELVEGPTVVDVLKQFRTETHKQFDDTAGVVVLRPVGVSEYLVFNALGANRRRQPGCTSRVAGLQLQCRVGAEASVAMGPNSTDDLSFDIFGKVAESATALAMIASITTLSVDKNTFLILTTAVRCSSKIVNFKVSVVTYSAFKCVLQRT